MSKAPRKTTAEFKFKLAIEALKGERPITSIASEHGIHPKQIMRWRDQLLAEGGGYLHTQGHAEEGRSR